MSDKKRIIFVDDDPNVLTSLRRMLRGKRQEWESIFVDNGKDALRKIRSGWPDAVVTDVKMPGMSGLELLRTVQESDATRDIPTIVLTGIHERNIKRQALDLGAADLLAKPVDLENLIARIRSVLCLKDRHDQLKHLNASIEHRVEERTRDLEAARFDIIWRLAKAGEFRDEMTGNHVARVGCYCRILSERLGMPVDFVERVFLTSSLHDIGKIGIPGEILLKQGKLTAEEFGVMQQHCVIGAQILRERPLGMDLFLEWRGAPDCLPVAEEHDDSLEMACTIAMSHHERWCGGGYPAGLSGQDIPLEARITALADTYDALSSNRPYKTAYCHEKTIEIMRTEAHEYFDPEVFAAFEDSLDEFCAVYTELSDNNDPFPDLVQRTGAVS